MKDNPAFEELFGDTDAHDDFLPPIDDIIADWPRARASISKQKLPSVVIDYSPGKPFTLVVIALVPTANSTHVPAYMEFGGYNDCPAPAWHVAALKYFETHYGAKIVGLSHDTLDLVIAKKPTTREGAAKAALALYVYCPDLMEQGTGSISELAQQLMAHDSWSLWWD